MFEKLIKAINRKFPDRLNTIGLIGVLLVVLLGALLKITEPQGMQALQNSVFDQYQRWEPRIYSQTPVKIIDIDEASLAKVGQWPWPRDKVAQLIHQLALAKVNAIALDMIFSEPDRTSPKTISKHWDLSASTHREINKLADHDITMAKALSESQSISGYTLERDDSKSAPPKRRFNIVNMGDSPLPYLQPFSGSLNSLELFESKVSGNGALNYIPDQDGVVRRVPLMMRLGNDIYPSLTAEALRVSQHAHNFIIKTSSIKNAGIEGVIIGKIKIPTTRDGQLWIHYSQANPERYIPAWKILDQRLKPKYLAGNIVIIGTSAKGLMDQRNNALGLIIPGVEAHAQAIEQILNQTFLARPHWALWLELLVILVGGLIVGIIALNSRAIFSATFTLTVISGLNISGWIAFSRHGLLLDLFTPSLILLITFSIASIIHHRSTERKQQWIKEAFSRYVSPNFVSHLVEHPESLKLGGERRFCSFIFTDLSDFTSLMESIDPSEAVNLLNTYLDEMIAIAFQHDGTLDRIVGDAVAIMFSAPVAQSDHQQRAFNCAIEMHRFASRYLAALNSKGIAFGKTRIGVHSGEVIIGNFGGSTIFDYRALGDTVNTASRLESLNKHLGTTMCVSEDTLKGCKNVNVRPVGQIVLKGKTKPLAVYEVLEIEDISTPADEYIAAYELIETNPAKAIKAFKILANLFPEDALITFQLNRLMNNERGIVITMTQK
jgi:adenylate cyclase